MNLDEQFRVIFYSFIYGMFFLATLRYFKKINVSNFILKCILELFFLILHVCFFYFLLYKLNNGILSIYIGICFIFGCFFIDVCFALLVFGVSVVGHTWRKWVFYWSRKLDVLYCGDQRQHVCLVVCWLLLMCLLIRRGPNQL